MVKLAQLLHSEGRMVFSYVETDNPESLRLHLGLGFHVVDGIHVVWARYFPPGGQDQNEAAQAQNTGCGKTGTGNMWIKQCCT